MSLSSTDLEEDCNDESMADRDRTPLINHSEPPPDRYRLVLWIMFILGVGTLLPWNMFITATPYFDYKFNRTVDGNGTVIAPGRFRCLYENFFSVASMLPNLIAVILNVRYAHRFSLKWRIGGSLAIILISFVFTTCLIYPPSWHWQNLFFALTIISAAVMSAAGSTFQAGAYGLGGMLSDIKYIGAIMSGQGMAGIFASIANIFSIAGGNDPEDSALGYFLSAVTVTALCLLLLFVLLHLSYVRYFMTIQKHMSVNSSGSREQRSPRFRSIFGKVWLVGLSVFLTFFVTLAIFPGVAANIKSVRESKNIWTGKYFTPITCFLLFNFGDFVGRTIAPWIPLVSARFLWIPVLLRLVFLPLFALCNVQPRSADSPVVFDNDVYPIVFMTLMALSNGYLSTLGMMYGPGLVLTHERETAGVMMSFFLTSGLAAGAAFSFVITEGLNGFASDKCHYS